MAFLWNVTGKAKSALSRWPWQPRVFNSKVMALLSFAFAAWGALGIADADYGSALVCFVNTMLFGLWAHALWRREPA